MDIRLMGQPDEVRGVLNVLRVRLDVKRYSREYLNSDGTVRVYVTATAPAPTVKDGDR